MDILSFLFYFISFYAFMLLCYIPFMDRLARGMRRIALELALICLVLAALPVILSDTNYDEINQAVSVAFYFVFFFYLKKTVRDGTQKVLFITLIAVHTLCIGTELEFSVMTLFGVFPLTSPTAAPWAALFFPMRLALYVAVGFVLRRVFTPRLRAINAKDMKGLSALPVVFASISIYRGAEYYYNGVIDPLYPLIFLLLTAASFFVYWQMLRMLDSVTKSARLEIETQRLTMKTDFYHKMAHDLLTPLTIVSTSIQVAKVEPEDKELMNKSQAEIMKMAGMINDALRGGDDK